VLNADDEYVSQFGRDFKGKVLLYGTRENASVRAERIHRRVRRDGVRCCGGNARQHAVVPLVGEHNVLNALAAVAVGLESGLKPSQAVSALATLAPAENVGRFSTWVTSR